MLDDSSVAFASQNICSLRAYARQWAKQTGDGYMSNFCNMRCTYVVRPSSLERMRMPEKKDTTI